jgi:hypothetical protein
MYIAGERAALGGGLRQRGVVREPGGRPCLLQCRRGTQLFFFAFN